MTRRRPACLAAMAALPVRYMHLEELSQRLREPETAGSTQVIDVRDSDFGGGCVAGAWHEPSEQWSSEAYVAQLAQRLVHAQRTSVVLHCMYSQQRGPACAARLARVAGDSGLQISVLSGGWMAWRRAYGDDTELTTPLDT